MWKKREKKGVLLHMIDFKTRMEEYDLLSEIWHKMSLSHSYKYS